MDICLDTKPISSSCLARIWCSIQACYGERYKKSHVLQQMYNEWPFFRVTIDLVEMVFAKGDPRITALYDKLLVSKDLWAIGEQLRANCLETKNMLLQVA